MKGLATVFFISSFVIVLKAQIVNTQSGQIQGQMNGTVYEFLGVPFAHPPVESLRWKAPVDPVKWDEVRMTIEYAPVCPQKRFEQGDTTAIMEGEEDCLYLNIWTPTLDGDELPVMVFIHGGGNQQGGASQKAGGAYLYEGKNLAERGDVVVVTIQYRLGPLGFLVHPGLEDENKNGVSGNYAILDQILALKWVRNNISAFGGNPENVTIFGESAGGLDIGDLLISPLAEGLFHRAIIQSAVPVVDDYSKAKNEGIDFVDKYVSSGTDKEKIAKMRTLPADSLINGLESPLQGGIVQSKWHPVLDNYVFQNMPINQVQSGSYNKVPVMIGSNADEMNLSVPQVVTPLMVNALVLLYIPAQSRSEVLRLYSPGTTNEQARKAYVGILSDLQFTSPVRRMASCLSRNQEEPVWNYYFTYKHVQPLISGLGSYHGMELPYVFNTWENSVLGGTLINTPQDDSLQNVFLSYWVNFARTGNPNGTDMEEWPRFYPTSQCYLEINTLPDGTQCGLKTDELDLWDEVVGFIGCSQSVGVSEFISDENSFSIFPNPTNDFVFVNNKESENSEISIYNSTGQKLNHLVDTNWIDLSGQPSGLYFIQMKSEKGIVTKKILKQ